MNKKRNPQKRGGFVSIGDVADGLSLPGGRALTHRAATPQARHHFTRLDQIDQLVAARDAQFRLSDVEEPAWLQASTYALATWEVECDVYLPWRCNQYP